MLPKCAARSLLTARTFSSQAFYTYSRASIFFELCTRLQAVVKGRSAAVEEKKRYIQHRRLPSNSRHVLSPQQKIFSHAFSTYPSVSYRPHYIHLCRLSRKQATALVENTIATSHVQPKLIQDDVPMAARKRP